MTSKFHLLSSKVIFQILVGAVICLYCVQRKAPVTRISFHLKTQDIVAVSPPVHKETMKTIMETQYAIQSENATK